MLNSCEQIQDPASSVGSADPPFEHFGSQVPQQSQPIHELNKHGDSGGGGFQRGSAPVRQ